MTETPLAAPYADNLELQATNNTYFRRVLFTGKHEQLVLMSLKPNEDIGNEMHAHTDQFIRVEKGDARVTIAGIHHEVKSGGAVVIPAGAKHNVLNTSTTNPLKLYTVYAPPHHPIGTVHLTKAEANQDERNKQP